MVVNLSSKLQSMEKKNGPYDQMTQNVLPTKIFLKPEAKSAAKIIGAATNNSPSNGNVNFIYNLHHEILKDDQVRQEPMHVKMDRNRTVNNEIRHHRGKPKPPSPYATTKPEKTDKIEKPDEQKYPWEVREEIKQYEIKRMVAKKPGHQNRKDNLL